MVDCVGYPYLVFSRQCQVYPYSSPSPSFVAPFSSIVVLHNIARVQVHISMSHTAIHSFSHSHAGYAGMVEGVVQSYIFESVTKIYCDHFGQIHHSSKV